MADYAGHFVWHELMTTDPPGAKRFYSGVVGWELHDWEESSGYTMFTMRGTPVAGVMGLTEDARARGVPTHWLGYIGVEDVDEAADRVQKLGGQLLVGPRDIPRVGRFAVVLDPQGAAFALFRGPDDEPDQQVTGREPGRVGWHELYTTNWEEAFAFYSEMFGWSKGEAMDMGADGIYQLFNRGEDMLGGMMNKPAQMPTPAWLYYFNVGDIDAAAARVAEGGGKVLNGPMEVPGGGWILQATDPQGGVFALFGTRG